MEIILNGNPHTLKTYTGNFNISVRRALRLLLEKNRGLGGKRSPLMTLANKPITARFILIIKYILGREEHTGTD